MPIIPPLFYKNCFITDFKEKAKLFNFFSKQRSLISNNNSLPAVSLQTPIYKYIFNQRY